MLLHSSKRQGLTCGNACTFVRMSMLKMPKSIAWILATMLVMLLLMMAYRLFVLALFAPEPAPASVGQLLWLGFKYDLRYVSLFTLPVLLASFSGSLHLFKSSAGKKFGIIVFTIFSSLLLLLYGIDVANLIAYNEHASGETFHELIRQQAADKKLMTDAPWVIIILLAGVGAWLLYLLHRLLHHAIGVKKSSDNKTMRLFWQGLTLLICVAALYGNIGTKPLQYNDAKQWKNEQAATAALNVFECMAHSIRY